MGRQFGDHIGDSESGRVGVGEDTGDEGAEATSPLLSGSGLLGRSGADERPDASAGFEHARAFKVGIHPGHGVGIDAEVDGELADGWKLIAGPQTARGDGGAEPALELRVNRCAVARVDGNETHRTNTNVLVQ
jgi:hypothetical protein